MVGETSALGAHPAVGGRTTTSRNYLPPVVAFVVLAAVLLLVGRHSYPELHTTLDTGMFLTSIKLNGGTMGANIEHPLFVSVPADKSAPVPDQLDRFFNLKMNEKAGGSDPLGLGSAEFEGFLSANMIEIRFKVVKAFQPDTGKPAMG